MTDTTTARRTLTAGLPACPSGRHVAHPAYTCEEQDAAAEAWNRYFSGAFRTVRAQMEARDVPATLRGPRAEPPAADPGPLREVAAQALGQQPGPVRRDPRADDPNYHPITGYRTWEQLGAEPPQFTGIANQTTTERPTT